MSKLLIDRAVVERALKALEKADRISGYRNNWAEILCLRAALEQPQVEQEPVAEVIESHVRPSLDGLFTAEVASRERLSVGAELFIHQQPPRQQPQVEQEPAPNGATHRQPKQGAFYKRVDGKWYVWSRMENGEPHRWYISPGTAESCLEPIYTHPQPPRQPLTDDEIEKLFPYTHEWLYEVGLEEATKFARSIEAAHGIKEQK